MSINLFDPQLISNTTANLFLKFSNIPVLLTIIITGLTFFKRRIFSQAVIILLFSIICNTLLKSYFKIPHSDNQFAFPSGHMQSAVVFYGWLFINYHSMILRLLLLILLYGIGLSLMHFNYHNFIDIEGAIGFGLILLACYKIILYIFEDNSHSENFIYYALFILMTGMVYYISKLRDLPDQTLMTYLSFIGFTSGYLCRKLFDKSLYNSGTNNLGAPPRVILDENMIIKFCSLLLIVSTAAVIHYIFKLKMIDHYPFKFMQYMIISFIVYQARPVTVRILQRYRNHIIR